MNITFNFKKHKDAQDMIRRIMRDKELTVEDAIRFSITKENFGKIVNYGWARIAVSIWGHGELDFKELLLDKTSVSVELSDEQQQIFSFIKADCASMTGKCHQNYDIDIDVLSQFLIFTMDDLGYHI